MKSHISFNGKSLDIIPSQGKVGSFRILSEKTKQKAQWKKQTNYVVNQFQANVPFRHPLKTT